jgi:PAS domain S-box-containing protein
MKFTAKLTAAFVLVALIPVATLGYLSYSSAKDALEKQALEDLTLIADAKEGHLYSYIELIKGRAVDFSSDGFICDTIESLRKLDADDPYFAELQMTLNQHLKRNKMPLDRSVQLISVADMSGEVLASTDVRELGADESHVDYFVHGKNGIYISDLHIRPRISKGAGPTVAIAAPLTSRKSGTPLGVLINFYDTDELNKILSGKFSLDKGAPTSLPGKEKTLNIYLVNKDQLLITPSIYGNEVMKQKIETPPVLECAAGREMTAVYRNYLGSEVLGSSMCIPSLGWTLLAEIDTKEAFATVETLKNRTIVSGILIALLAFYLAYFLAKESQRSLRAEKSRLEALIRGMNEGVVFADAQDNVALLNATAEDICRETDAGPPGNQLLHDYRCNIEQFSDKIQAIKAGRLAYYAGEASYRDRNFEVTISPIRRDADYVGTVMIFHDMTERKRMEEALRETNDALQALIQSSPLAIVGLDTSGNVNVWSKAAERIFGWSAHEAIGRFLPIVPDDKQEEFRGLCEKVLRGEPLADVEVRQRKKDGSPIDIRISAAPLYGSKGSINGIMAVLADVTELKKLEEQLRHAQKMEAVGQLAGGIAHDFNNILTAIIGYGSMLMMKMRKDDPLRHNVDQILAASGRAANLTKSLLAFSRKQILNIRSVNINEIITRVEGLLSKVIGEDIELKTVLADKDIIVSADAGQIEQLLMNLAVNARDAMPKGGMLTVETGLMEMDEEYRKIHAFGTPGEYAVISVSDTGVGMDEATRKRIFEPFFTTKDVGKGTGLGLAMVYGMIKQHKGYINVYSELGKGTTFKIYLPRVLTGVDEENQSLEHIGRIGGTETILLAEDDADVRKLTKTMLEEAGYTVIEAEDGEEALNRFTGNEDKVRLLLLDVIMPKKNGREVYVEIRKTHPAMKALFMSGYTANVIHKKGILEKDLNFISKPFNAAEFLGMVRKILDA